MTKQEARDAIQFREYDAYLANSWTGEIKAGTMQVGIEGVYKLLEDVDSFNEFVYKAWSKGVKATFKATFKSNSIEYLNERMLIGQTTQNIKGSYFGKKTVDLDGIAEELWLHPQGVSTDDKTADFKFWKAVPQLVVQLTFGTELPSEYEVEFILMPDPARDDDKSIGFMGDWSYVESAPDAVIITCGNDLRDPLFSETAATLLVAQDVKRQAQNIYVTDSAITFDNDDDPGPTSATATTITFENLSTANGITEGSYCKVGTGGTLQYLYIESVTYTTTTSGTLTVVRNCINHNAGTIADAVEFALIESIDVERATEIATWASSDPTKATVGDNFQSATFTDNNGVIAHVATGSTNVTATTESVASPNCVVTAT